MHRAHEQDLTRWAHDSTIGMIGIVAMIPEIGMTRLIETRGLGTWMVSFHIE